MISFLIFCFYLLPFCNFSFGKNNDIHLFSSWTNLWYDSFFTSYFWFVFHFGNFIRYIWFGKRMWNPSVVIRLSTNVYMMFAFFDIFVLLSHCVIPMYFDDTNMIVRSEIYQHCRLMYFEGPSLMIRSRARLWGHSPLRLRTRGDYPLQWPSLYRHIWQNDLDATTMKIWSSCSHKNTHPSYEATQTNIIFILRVKDLFFLCL